MPTTLTIETRRELSNDWGGRPPRRRSCCIRGVAFVLGLPAYEVAAAFDRIAPEQRNRGYYVPQVERVLQDLGATFASEHIHDMREQAYAGGPWGQTRYRWRNHGPTVRQVQASHATGHWLFFSGSHCIGVVDGETNEPMSARYRGQLLYLIEA